MFERSMGRMSLSRGRTASRNAIATLAKSRISNSPGPTYATLFLDANFSMQPSFSIPIFWRNLRIFPFSSVCAGAADTSLGRMPALVVFGRRSRVVGSDDLYCPALVLLLFQLPLLAVCAVYLALWRRCSTLTLDESGLPFWFMLAAVPMLVFMACIDLMVLHVSAKGTIVDYERRMVMPRVLHVHTLWSALTFAFGLAGVALWYFRDLCYPDSNFVLVQLLLLMESLGGDCSLLTLCFRGVFEQGVASCMVAEVSFTFTLGFCLLTDEHSEEIVPHTATGEVDPYGNALGCERQSLLDGMPVCHASSSVLPVVCHSFSSVH